MRIAASYQRKLVEEFEDATREHQRVSTTTTHLLEGDKLTAHVRYKNAKQSLFSALDIPRPNIRSMKEEK